MAGDHLSTDKGQSEVEDFGYRFDLKHAVGVMITTPYHSTDAHGEITWGTLDQSLQGKSEFVDHFQNEMEDIFETAVKLHLGGIATPNRKQLSHKYFQPPAAQGWPEIALWLWDYALPALGAFDTLVSTGRTIREVKKRVSDWFQAKADEVQKDAQPDWESSEWRRIQEAFEPQITLTPLDVAGLTSVDAYERLGMRDVTRVTVFTRAPVGTGGADHPGPMNSYLTKIEEPGRTCAYVSDASGNVIEQFLMTRGPITPLSIPYSPTNAWTHSEASQPVVLEFG